MSALIVGSGFMILRRLDKSSSIHTFPVEINLSGELPDACFNASLTKILFAG